MLYGAGTKSRTRDLLITNQLLYQLSYTGFLGVWARIIRLATAYDKSFSAVCSLRAAGDLTHPHQFFAVAFDHGAGALPRR